MVRHSHSVAMFECFLTLGMMGHSTVKALSSKDSPFAQLAGSLKFDSLGTHLGYKIHLTFLKCQDFHVSS